MIIMVYDDCRSYPSMSGSLMERTRNNLWSVQLHCSIFSLIFDYHGHRAHLNGREVQLRSFSVVGEKIDRFPALFHTLLLGKVRR